MHLKIQKMAKLLENVDRDEAILRQSIKDGTFSPETVPQEIRERFEAIFQLQEEIPQLEPAQAIDMSEQNNGKKVYDEVARKYIDALESPEGNDERVLLQLLVDTGPHNFDMMRRNYNDPGLKERLSKALVAYHLVTGDTSVKHDDWDETDDAQKIMRENVGIDYTGTLAESFHELARRQKWNQALSIYESFFVYNERGAENLDIPALCEESREAIAIEYFKKGPSRFLHALSLPKDFQGDPEDFSRVCHNEREFVLRLIGSKRRSFLRLV